MNRLATLAIPFAFCFLNATVHADYDSASQQIDAQNKARDAAEAAQARQERATEAARANVTFANCHGGFAAGPSASYDGVVEFTTNDGWECKSATNFACANVRLNSKFMVIDWPLGTYSNVSIGNAEEVYKCFAGHSSGHRKNRRRSH